MTTVIVNQMRIQPFMNYNLPDARIRDLYIPPRYPNSHPEGAPFEHYGPSRATGRFVMPVRSSTSSVLRWPDAATVVGALRRWAEATARAHPEVRGIGYFGSYARGDWGVGSDLDVVMLVDHSREPFERRGARWDTTRLPVPVDLLVYTVDEWERLGREGRRLDQRGELIWR